MLLTIQGSTIQGSRIASSHKNTTATDVGLVTGNIPAFWVALNGLWKEEGGKVQPSPWAWGGGVMHWLCVCVIAQFVWLFMTPWSVVHQAPLSMGFSRQECRSGLLFPPPGDLPDPGMEPWSPALQVNSLSSEPPAKPILTKNQL